MQEKPVGTAKHMRTYTDFLRTVESGPTWATFQKDSYHDPKIGSVDFLDYLIFNDM